MSKSGSIGILPIIIALTIGYNLFFDDDDEKTEVVEEPSEIREQLKDVGNKLKDVGSQLKDNLTEMIDDAKEEYIEDDPPEEKLDVAKPSPEPDLDEEVKPESKPEDQEGKVL